LKLSVFNMLTPEHPLILLLTLKKYFGALVLFTLYSFLTDSPFSQHFSRRGVLESFNGKYRSWNHVLNPVHIFYNIDSGLLDFLIINPVHVALIFCVEFYATTEFLLLSNHTFLYILIYFLITIQYSTFVHLSRIKTKMVANGQDFDKTNLKKTMQLDHTISCGLGTDQIMHNFNLFSTAIYKQMMADEDIAFFLGSSVSAQAPDNHRFSGVVILDVKLMIVDGCILLRDKNVCIQWVVEVHTQFWRNIKGQAYLVVQWQVHGHHLLLWLGAAIMACCIMQIHTMGYLVTFNMVTFVDLISFLLGTIVEIIYAHTRCKNMNANVGVIAYKTKLSNRMNIMIYPKTCSFHLIDDNHQDPILKSNHHILMGWTRTFLIAATHLYFSKCFQ
ncbi:hypothetical protein ACJX0J_040530, partial [Zea mays]